MPATLAPHSLRVLVGRDTDPQVNLALEDELLGDVERGSCPDTLRLWVSQTCLVRGPHRAPSSGWHDEERARDRGVPVYRRSTGGGSVYHDIGNLNWSFYLRRMEGFIGSPRLFARCAGVVVTALAQLGIAGRFQPPNRIDVRGRKVSGMASRATHGAVLVHGTLLVSTDLEPLQALCIPPPGCPPVTRLCDLDPAIAMADVMRAIAAAAVGVPTELVASRDTGAMVYCLI